jgi:hypothetical protein
MPDFTFDDDATEELRSDILQTIQMLSAEIADAFEPLLLLLVESIEAMPPNLRAAAIAVAKERLTEILGEDGEADD